MIASNGSLAGVYVVTDGTMLPGRTHIEIAEACVAAGAGCVQLREKNLPDRDVFELAIAIRRMTEYTKTIFIVNNRADIAVACGADGLHVGQDDLSAAVARKIIGPDAILGVSALSVEDAVRAEADGADYVAPGPIFATASKSDAGPVMGLASIREIKQAVNIPVVAIGGIGLANIAEISEAGAESAAVISAVVCAPDMADAIRVLQTEFQRGKSLVRK